jgi:tetratricopeptide (TPR) repeat protein
MIMRKIIVSIFLVLTFLCSCSEWGQTALGWFNKALALNYTDPEKAIEYLNNAIKLQPKYVDAYHLRGINYATLKQFQPAIEDFNEAIRLQPTYIDAYKSRGVTYTTLLQYQRAIEDFNKVISLKPDADAYKCRGYVYFNQGNKKLGCSDAKKACDLGNCQLSEVAKNKGNCR